MSQVLAGRFLTTEPSGKSCISFLFMYLPKYLYIYMCVCVCVYIYIYIYVTNINFKFINSFSTLLMASFTIIQLNLLISSLGDILRKCSPTIIKMFSYDVLFYFSH